MQNLCGGKSLSRIAMMMLQICFLCGSDNTMRNMDKEDVSQMKEKDVYGV